MSAGSVPPTVVAHPAPPARKLQLGRAARGLHVLAFCVAAAAALVVAAVVVGPRFLPYRALIVRSGSMSPTIPTGSVAFYRQERAAQVGVGQIILFSEPGDPSVWITHRVLRIDETLAGRYFVTKGDANASADPWRVPARGVGWVVAYHVPDLGFALAELSTPWARWVLIAVPAFGLALLILFDLAKPRRAPPRAPVALPLDAVITVNWSAPCHGPGRPANFEERWW